MKRLLLAGVIAGLSSACAYAADLGPYRAPPPERDYYEPVRDMPWSWRGFYGGVNAGYAWGGDDSVTLSGPGIAGMRRFSAEPLPPDFRARLIANRDMFPRGVDLILVTENAVAALPRSVRVAT